MGLVPRFDRGFLRSPHAITRIGEGELGGKARGLLLVDDLLAADLERARYPSIHVDVPKMAVVATGVFDAFMERNGLHEAALAGMADEHITRRFLGAELPAEIVGDLRALVEEVRTPLAVRSSSLLEDALFRPFAGVYETKMVPNNQPDPDTRFLRLAEAVKFVYASTFFESARLYIDAAGRKTADEKMAVIVQEVVGARHGDRFYPHLSGVGRSYNFFPVGGADRRAGVVSLALGLGKTIVDGGTSWTYSPARPKAPPPFGSPSGILRYTQTGFWAVNMGKPPAYDPTRETEYLVHPDLSAADYDGTLSEVASTYDPARDRLVPGTALAGPRAVDFSPLLVHGTIPFNALVRELLALGERRIGREVEIEFAMTLPGAGEGEGRLGFLQLRPMLVSEDEVRLSDAEVAAPGLLLASDRIMGNGMLEAVRDIVYVRPAAFEARLTPAIAGELAKVNRALLDEGRPYMLMGFGRWGSSDPWLGTPVEWGQISGARVIVEATLPGMDVTPSQGAHFFHNIIGFQVLYLCVSHRDEPPPAGRGVDWDWLERQPAASETDHVRHLRLEQPLRVKLDGRAGRGAVWHA